MLPVKNVFEILLASFAAMAIGREPVQEPQALITSVDAFDGLCENRIQNAGMLVDGNWIKEVSASTRNPKGSGFGEGLDFTLRERLKEGIKKYSMK